MPCTTTWGIPAFYLIWQPHFFSVIRFLLVPLFFLGGLAFAQQGNLAPGFDYIMSLNRHLDRLDSRFHTAVRPYLRSEVQEIVGLDSALGLNNGPGFGDNFTQGDIVKVGNEKYNFRLNPLLDLRAGYDIPGKEFLYSTGYGAQLEADISPYFSLSATYRGIYENPATYLANDYNTWGILTGYRMPQQKAAGSSCHRILPGMCP